MQFDNRSPQKLPAQRSLARPGGASFPAQRGPLRPCAALSMTCLAGIAGIALCVENGLAQQAGAGGRAAAPAGRGAQAPDPRVQQRTYTSRTRTRTSRMPYSSPPR